MTHHLLSFLQHKSRVSLWYVGAFTGMAIIELTINHEFCVAFNGAGKKYPKAPLVKAPGKQKCNKEEEETASVGMIIFWTRKS